MSEPVFTLTLTDTNGAVLDAVELNAAELREAQSNLQSATLALDSPNLR